MSSISKLILVVLTLSIGYVFIYPSYGEISSLMDQRQEYEKYLDMISNIENKKNELLTQLNNMPAEDKKNVETILPSSLNFVKLVSDIDAVGSKYGITIDQVTSKETDSSVGDSVAEAQPERPYKSAIIGFSFKASYDNFTEFMGELEKSMRILDIKSLKVNAQKTGIHIYAVEFETYWIKK